MKIKMKVFGERCIRMMFTLPLFLFLMGLSISCEEDLIMDEDNKHVTPDKNIDPYSANPMSSQYINITRLDFPVKINYEVESVDGSNIPGTLITFSGLVTTRSGFGVNTIFRNDIDTNEYDDKKSVEVDLIPTGKEIIIPKQSSSVEVSSSNPYIYIQFENAQGKAVSKEIFVGRIAKGASFKGSKSVLNSATSFDKYTITDCANCPGPNITFDAGISIEGLNARIIFRNNVKSRTHVKDLTHDVNEEVSSVAKVIDDGMEFSFPKQPVHGSLSGNTWIWTQFTAGNSRAASNEILLGRWEKISNPSDPQIHFNNKQ